MSSSKDSYFFTPRADSYSTKKNSTLLTSEAKRSTRTSKTAFTSQADCLFCASGFRKNQKLQFSGMVNKALYSKYSSSQNYYYTKDINEILAESRTSAVILFKDYLHIDEEEEYLKRFYLESEYDFKIKMLTEYYKFHNDIARVFMMPATNVVNRYHDKKRRLEYVRVTNLLKAEQDGENLETKPKEEERRNPKDFIITDRILDELNITDAEPKKHKRASSNLKGNQPYLGKAPVQDNKNPVKKTNPVKYTPVIKGNVVSKPKDKVNDQSNRDISISHTIHDLNLKLGEIISNSRTQIDINYLESSNIQPNDTMSNLANFLMFMDKNPQGSKMNEIPGIANTYITPVPKIVNSVPLTDRPYRPESGLISRAKQTPRADATRPSEHLTKMTSPSTSKASIKPVKTSERIKERPEDKSMTPSLITKQQSSIQCLTDRPKATVSVAKIKNFEEAIKINLQNSQHRGSTQSSVPRENLLLQDRVLSMATTASQTARGSTARVTPYKIADERSNESSSISKQKTPLYSSTTTRPASRTKTKSTDMYTKALDLLLGTNQNGASSSTYTTTKREPETQLHTKTKSTFNFKLKTPSSNILTTQNEKSSARDEGSGLVTNNKVTSSRLASDRIYMQTEREVKKVNTFANLDIPTKKDNVYVPLSERELPREYSYKSGGTKTSGKVTPALRETDNLKPNLATFTTEQKKIGLHKYTKSEGRMKKLEGAEKVEVVSATRAMMGSTMRSKVFDQSPKRQNYTYNNNNVVNVFLNSNGTNGERKIDRTISLKTDRQPQQDGLYHNEGESLTKLFKSRSPNGDVIAKFNQSLPKKINLGNHDIDYKNLDFSPLRANMRDGLMSNRVLSERSPPNFAATFRSKATARPDFDMLRRDLRFDNFDAHGKSKEKS